MSTPPVPPRPSRSQNAAGASNTHMEVPKIPPRPKRSIDRSMSPNRDAFARSPLNDPDFNPKNRSHSRDGRLSTELPPRPPSVTLPSLGQEGSEYASLEDLSQTLSREDRSSSPHHTKNVGDLPLFAPKASVPSTTAKSRIQTVTRTDSSQAAAIGIGKLASEDRAASSRPGSSAGNRTRPTSIYREDTEEQGIPEIGVQVPMYPNAGDVQAPTPGPHEHGHSGGVGFFNKDGLPSGRRHARTKSGREIFHGPPGSYGRHGHGVIPKDEIEKQWYEKHPDAFAREKAGEYGPHIRPERKEYHWVGDDLVKLVHRTSATGAGVGTSREAIGTPDEQIGYMATDEYLRIASPKPQSGRPASIHVDSPLRKESGADDEAGNRDSQADHEVIHINPPAHPTSKIHGGGYDPPTEDLGPEGGNTAQKGGWIEEHGYGVPILASDEIQRRPENEWRQPAVPPELERRASGEFNLNDSHSHPQYVSKPRTHSRSSSRNSQRMARFASPSEHHDGTPLESMKEYEPLFPEEDDDKQQKPKTLADKFKRPDLARHHFPSQDIWEDAPNSLQLETTVETPQDPEEEYEEQKDPDAGTVFEHPESEKARMEEPGEDQKSFLHDHEKRFTNKHLSNVDRAGRPGQHRFPSHDVWEDAPDHGHLVTTVSSPQVDAHNDYEDSSPVVEKAPPLEKPDIPARPQTKETSPTEKRAPPVIPERPKPSIPARPSRSPVSARSSEKEPTAEAKEEATQPKAKPPVPARPAGSKIAAMQANFLKDLNNKLGLGPQAPKPKDPEPEKVEEEAPKPLQDARKGRAKGPQRRKPASQAPAPAATITAGVAVPRQKLEISQVTPIWSIGDDGVIDVPAAAMAKSIRAALAPKQDVAAEEKEELKVQAEVPEDATEETLEPVKSEESIQSATEPAEPSLSKTVSKESAASATEKPETVTEAVSKVEDDLPGAFPTEEPQADKNPADEKVNQAPIESSSAKETISPETDSPAAKTPPSTDDADEPEIIDKPSSPDAPANESASAEPAKTAAPELPGSSFVQQSGEPVDMALVEEGKDSERRDIGL